MSDISNFELFRKINAFSHCTHRHPFGPEGMPPEPPMGPQCKPPVPPMGLQPMPPQPPMGPQCKPPVPPMGPQCKPPVPPMGPQGMPPEGFPRSNPDRFHGPIPCDMRPEPHFSPMNGERPPFPPFDPEGPHHRPPRRPPLSREHLLVIISGYPDGIRQKQLSETVGINQSSASELISKLENDGYIKRSVDPSDKRATLLFLTELGQARAAEVEDEREAAFEGFFNVLSEEEKRTLSDILDKLLAAQELKHLPEQHC